MKCIINGMKFSTSISTRRSFVCGAGAMGVLAGTRGLAAAPVCEKPNLRVGIISDIHVRVDAVTGKTVGYSDDKTFVHALEWFRDQGVDAVLLPGDMADYGKLSEMQVVADDWFRVFPNDRAPDGRHVERLFVFGNHDWDVFDWPTPKDRLLRYGAADKADVPKFVMSGDPARNWDRFWHEPFERVFLKRVKDYVFIGAHWMDGDGATRYAAVKPFVEAHRRDIDPSRPFFYFQHPHPQGTIFPWTRFHDCGAATAALSPFPNAVAITGHSHYSITDERGIWQGAFTSVNAGCMRFTEPPLDTRPPLGYENTRATRDQAKNDPVKMMQLMWADWTGRQGMLMDVFDDRIVFARRDFLHDLSLGDDWVVPLGRSAPKTYSFAPRKAASVAPQFPASAKLDVRRTRAKTRGVDGKPDSRVEKDVFEITVPQANAVSAARPFEYELYAVVPDGSRTALTTLLDAGYAHSPKNQERQIPLKCPVAVERLPKTGSFRFEAIPVGNWGKKGRSIISDEISVAEAKV